jgi:hypothetical protein
MLETTGRRAALLLLSTLIRALPADAQRHYSDEESAR